MKKPKVDPSAPRKITVPIGTPFIDKGYPKRVRITPEHKIDFDTSLLALIVRLSSVYDEYKDVYEDMYIDSETDHGYYDDHTYYYVAGTRLETQLEVDFRLSKEEKIKKQNEDEERKEYERLKKKFGDGKGDKK